MSDEIETIDKNPKSWAAWKREAERLQAIIDDMALAAMDSSESIELPLDYLQGHKDGLEWAARLAEANHHDTGDWLYDDPIELAKAIRKGPDMPPVQPVADSEPVIVVGDDGGDALSYRRLIQSFEPGTKLYRHAQPAPAVPGKWIPVSEWMPEVGEIVLAAMGGAVIVSETECTATGLRFFTSVISGRELPATHWMPLPAGPKEDINALIPLVSRNEQEVK